MTTQEPITDQPQMEPIGATDAAAMPMKSPPNGARREGGQPGNGNAVKHGLRIAKAHTDWSSIENDAYTFRTALRNAVVDAHGSLTLLADALIQSACRHERRAALAERWLRLQGDALPLSDRINLLAAVSSATDARDKAIRSLGIDRPQGNEWVLPPASPVEPSDSATAFRSDATASDGSAPGVSEIGDNAAPCMPEKLPDATEAA